MRLVLVCASVMTACRAEEPTERPVAEVSSDELQAARAHWPAGVAVLVDSARAAYSAQNYVSALALYRRAAVLAPDLRAAWYGVYIAEHARGNVMAADSALARAQQLEQGR
jgi:hypothetical protein